MDDKTMMQEKQKCCPLSRTAFFSWRAVFIGTLVGIGLNFLCFLLELSVGLTAFPTTETGAMVFSISGFLGLIILSIVTMFIVGWLTAYLGRSCQSPKHFGELYGFTAWSLSLIITMFLASYVSQQLTNYGYIVNRSAAHMIFDTSILQTVPKNIENKVATPKTENAQKSDILAMTTFSIFSLFFISALSSCFGGRCAMLRRKNCMNGKCCNTG